MTSKMRVALYARYSSDQQRAASIEDQFRICREHASRAGWTVVAEHADPALSGASMLTRPGVQALLLAALNGQYDVVLAESLDRFSRDQADSAIFFKKMNFARVQIITIAEGAPWRPVVTSHGASAEYGPPNRLHAELDWSGTYDPSNPPLVLDEGALLTTGIGKFACGKLWVIVCGVL